MTTEAYSAAHRDPRVLNDPALKLTSGMEAAFAIALEHAGRHENVTVRIIDADVLLDLSRMLPRRTPINVVEVFIDPTGVLVVGTGPDCFHPVYPKCLTFPHGIPLPLPDDEVSLHTFGTVLEVHIARAVRAVEESTARGLHGSTP